MEIAIDTSVHAAAKKDIVELAEKIDRFKKNEIAEDKFKLFRLTRGVYGQRQVGVQMIRIKLPYGKVTPKQLKQIADVSDRYATGNLHLTTRQDIQLHFVKLEDSPQLWAELEKVDVTLREACGNTVRNVTASPDAGIRPTEPFDVTPYAAAVTHYFLRNPICQDMGRKVKIAFASDDSDTAMTYFHDIGFIPKIKIKDGKPVQGFEVVLGGGLGAVAIPAQTVHHFLPGHQVIPFTEAVLRVFDRYGERNNRNKARLKFLIKKVGLDTFLKWVEQERKALKTTYFDVKPLEELDIPKLQNTSPITPKEGFQIWKSTNTFEQKQKGFYGVWIRVTLGDIDSATARELADFVEKHAANDIRVTANQGLLIKYVRPEILLLLHAKLIELDLAKAGFDSTHDITACPGSDTCNLAVTNSTGLTRALEEKLANEFGSLLHEQHLKIKISGCMNACGQHMAANIGFHGSSIKHNALVIPAMQVVLGGGIDASGRGFMAIKVIKIPTKRIPEGVGQLLTDFEINKKEDEPFNDYFQRQGKMYFYHLLKPLADVSDLEDSECMDWGKSEAFTPEIGVGECAGVMLDVIGSIIEEAHERWERAHEGLKEEAFADAIYNAYSSFVIGAKALLLSIDVQCNTQINILEDFESHFNQKPFLYETGFKEFVLRINKTEPDKAFAKTYLTEAETFLKNVIATRRHALNTPGQTDKQVVSDFYKA